MEEEKNINFTEGEVLDLVRAINCLILKEGDIRDYTSILNKLDTYYL